MCWMLKIHRGITNDTKIGKTLPILIFKLCGVLVFNFSLTLILWDTHILPCKEEMVSEAGQGQSASLKEKTGRK